jgi:hypothetical protein
MSLVRDTVDEEKRLAATLAWTKGSRESLSREVPFDEFKLELTLAIAKS